MRFLNNNNKVIIYKIIYTNKRVCNCGRSKRIVVFTTLNKLFSFCEADNLSFVQGASTKTLKFLLFNKSIKKNFC